MRGSKGHVHEDIRGHVEYMQFYYSDCYTPLTPLTPRSRPRIRGKNSRPREEGGGSRQPRREGAATTSGGAHSQRGRGGYARPRKRHKIRLWKKPSVSRRLILLLCFKT